MAYWGCEFIFDNIPCSSYGLMMYDFGSTKQDEEFSFKSGEIIEERISGRYDTLVYGLKQNQPLEFTLVFGANIDSLDKGKYLDRTEIEVIASWLTGHQSMKWLSIFQDDMHEFRYKCMITDLNLITYGNMPWAFSCKVTCDSPFGYTYPYDYKYSVSDSETITLHNRSTYNGYFYPNIVIETNGGDFSIVNLSDNGRSFEFKNLPSADSLIIEVDNKNQIIKCNTDMNLYPYFNFKFLRLIKGDNTLKIIGNASVKFTCVFPVDIGG